MEVGGSNTSYPGKALSNFSPHPFVFRGFECNSMEGFLQGLKFKSPEMQAEVFKLVGFAAKKKGKPKNWYRDQTLYFQGHPIKRDSQDYQDLLDEAYDELYKNDSFRKALEASGNAVLVHSIGKHKISETVLTEREFCNRLTRLRNGEILCKHKVEFPKQKLMFTEEDE
jgi:predicted NAD-dependent protein-ADP-ribosyltransferase YbiA (DUF1768 family)